MKRVSTIVIIGIVSISMLSAQEDYYFYKGDKIFLNKNPQKQFLLLDNFIDSIALREIIGNRGVIVKYQNKKNKLGLDINSKTFEINYAIVKSLNDSIFKFNKHIIYRSSYYFNSQKDEFGFSHIFYVKVKKLEDISILEKFAVQNNVQIVGNNSSMPQWFTLTCTNESNGNALDMANKFYESNLFLATEPDLIVDIKPCSITDPYYLNQWGLNNTGQYSGTSGIDIKASQAWQITKGDSNTIIAIIDGGIELNHPDLINSIYPVSYDTETSSSPSQVYFYGKHATSIAGIIGASHNNIGIAGIAPDCSLMSISNKMAGYPGFIQEFANGFLFATDNGAAVISNSWTYNYTQYSSSILTDAINYAITQGRNGLGTVVVFSSGNNDNSIVYPATISEVISVGAINFCGQRTTYAPGCDTELRMGSNFGNELDIMAPGVLIATTDRQGENGYNPSEPIHTLHDGTLISNDCTNQDYTLMFNGTSSAAPHVAAVAGLILSLKPELTQFQVERIIEKTAQKVGGYVYQTNSVRENGTWNSEMGYGLVDAYAALQLTECTSLYYNEVVNTTKIYTGCDIYVKNVIVQNIPNFPSVKLTIDAQDQVFFTGPFEVKLGSQLEIQ